MLPGSFVTKKTLSEVSNQNFSTDIKVRSNYQMIRQNFALYLRAWKNEISSAIEG